jgi:protein phosphatase
VHPNRSLITRALGIQDDVAVDVHPEALQLGDRLLLCSDGLSGMLTDDRLAAYLGAGDDPAEIVTVLVDAANAQGGEDNITAVVVFVDDISQTEAMPPSRRKRRLFRK